MKKGYLICLFAEAGTGKTTLAFTAENPLLLDADNGAYRAPTLGLGETLSFTTWEEMETLTFKEATNYKTVTIDTVGSFLGLLTEYVIRSNPKAGRFGSLTLQGYGTLKTLFIAFVNKLLNLGVDVILTAHDKITTSEENKSTQMDIIGGSEAWAKANCAFAFYMYSNGNGQRMLKFNPNGNIFAKNPFNFMGANDYPLPPESGMINQLSVIIDKFKKAANDNIEKAKKGTEVLKEIQSLILSAKVAKDFDNLIEKCNSIENEAMQKALKMQLNAKATEFGFSYNAETKSFTSK